MLYAVGFGGNTYLIDTGYLERSLKAHLWREAPAAMSCSTRVVDRRLRISGPQLTCKTCLDVVRYA
jgi:hypothetical protein